MNKEEDQLSSLALFLYEIEFDRLRTKIMKNLMRKGIMENPYSPFDPKWHIVETHLRRKRYKEDMEKIVWMMTSFRKRNWDFIMSVPSCSDSTTEERE